MYFGLFLIVFGFLFLARNLGILAEVDWGVVWPTMMVIFGVIFATRSHDHHRCCSWLYRCRHGEECDTKDCDCKSCDTCAVDEEEPKPRRSQKRPAKKETDAETGV